jgi:hypothetical protein
VSKNILLIAAIGAAVFLVVSKQAQAAAAGRAPAGAGGGALLTTAQKAQMGLIYTAPQAQSANVNGDMWTRLLGDGWRQMVGAQNSDGSAAFLKRGLFGQVTTSDGKPVSGGGDPIANYIAGESDNFGLPLITDYLGSISPYDAYLDGGGELLGW